MKLSKLMTGIATAAVAVAAWATVTFDPVTGTGFVGKGDVQTAFAWNNSMLQKNLKNVTFTFNDSSSSVITCQWTTGPDWNPSPHTQTHTRSVSVAGVVAYDPRVRNQITGITLKGYQGNVTDSFTLDGSPWNAIVNVGDPCPGNDGNGKVVTDITTTGTGAVLNANYGGVSKQVWPPLVPIL